MDRASSDATLRLAKGQALRGWTFATGNNIRSSPAVAGGMVYVGSLDKRVYALDASTGAEVWSFDTGDTVRSSPAVANGVVYVGSKNGMFFALDAGTGQELWSYATGSNVRSSPAVANGVVYVGSGDYYLYAFDASTGALLWSERTGNGLRWLSRSRPVRVRPPVASDSKIRHRFAACSPRFFFWCANISPPSDSEVLALLAHSITPIDKEAIEITPSSRPTRTRPAPGQSPWPRRTRTPCVRPGVGTASTGEAAPPRPW